MSRTLLRAAKKSAKAERNGDPDPISIGDLILSLGDRSFGWCVLLFALANMMPMPIGSNMITAIPLLFLTFQMAIGFHYVHLPEFITRREVDRRAFKRVVLRVRPVISRIEKVVRPRFEQLFTPRYERIMGGLMLAVAIALFMPIPLSGFIPAISLFVTAFGLVERDGYVTLAGLSLGVISVVITVVAALVIFFGVQAFAGH